jgi:glycosyltransferase involved in cell wall biosynthesis
VATDDPEGPEVYASLLKERDDRIIIISTQDTALVNALQRKAAVVLQKSIREGFGLTVAEAMWKGAAVVGGNTGSIRWQIKNDEFVKSIRLSDFQRFRGKAPRGPALRISCCLRSLRRVHEI